MVGIYKITNTINGKLYIGQSIDIHRRWNKHRTSPFNPGCSNYDCPLYRSIRKYGIKLFSFEVVEECLIEDLNSKEIFWIQYFDTTDVNKGYNLTKGGYFVSPKILTFEDVSEITDLLIDSKLSQQNIAIEFDISQRMVSAINLGQSWRRDELNYPLRIESILKEDSTLLICPLCGEKISKGAIRCRKCFELDQRKVTRPNRDALKEEIRLYSFVFLGKKYGVSDNAVRKWCKSYSLPYRSSDIKKITDKDWKSI